MTLFEIGRLCVKIAGRDAGRRCVVVEQLDNTFVLIDGDTRRKKVNVRHLEPSEQIVTLKKSASHEEVKGVFQKLGFSVWETKRKKAAERSRKQKKTKQIISSPKKKPVTKKGKEKAVPPASPPPIDVASI